MEGTIVLICLCFFVHDIEFDPERQKKTHLKSDGFAIMFRSCLEKISDLSFPAIAEMELTPYYFLGNRLSRLHRANPSAFLDKKYKELLQS